MPNIYKGELEECKSNLRLYLFKLLSEYKKLDKLEPEHQAELLHLKDRIEQVRILDSYIVDILNSDREIYKPNNLMKAMMNGIPLVAAIVLSATGLIPTDEDVVRFIEVYTRRLTKLKMFHSDEAYFEFNSREYEALKAVIKVSKNPYYQSDVKVFMFGESLLDQVRITPIYVRNIK